MYIKNVFLEPWFTAYNILEGKFLKGGIFGLQCIEDTWDFLLESLHETSPFLPHSNVWMVSISKGCSAELKMAPRTPCLLLNFPALRVLTLAHTAASGTGWPQSSQLHREGDVFLQFGDNLFLVFRSESTAITIHTSNTIAPGTWYVEGQPDWPLQAVHF